MADKYDVNDWLKNYRDAFAPVQNAQAEGLKAFERLARHQYAVAGDYIDFTLRAAKAAFDVRNGEDLLSSQRELGSELGTKLQKRAEEFVAIATEVQGNFAAALNKVAERTTAAPSRKAA